MAAACRGRGSIVVAMPPLVPLPMFLLVVTIGVPAIIVVFPGMFLLPLPVRDMFCLFVADSVILRDPDDLDRDDAALYGHPLAVVDPGAVPPVPPGRPPEPCVERE